VQRARADAESKINEAKAYYNSKLPVARGEAAKNTEEARGYKEAVVYKAKGDTARYLAKYQIYKKAPEITKKRMYLEMMEEILGGSAKIIIDGKSQSSQGVMPFLPLPTLAPQPAAQKEEGAHK
jgi:membrane protease subunit HflK